MDIISVFTISSIIILLGFAADWLFAKTNVPEVLWLLFVGVALKYLLKVNISQFSDIFNVFATFALIFILFQGILNFTIKKLEIGFVEGAKLSFFSLIFSVITCGIAMHFVGWNYLEGMLLGAMLSDSAQTVIVPLVKKISIGQSASLALIFESAITDVFTIIGSLSIISVLILNSFSLGALLEKLGLFFALSLIIGGLIGVIWASFQSRIGKFTKSSIPSICVLLLVYCIAEKFQANGVLACLSFGAMLGNSNIIFPDMEHVISQNSKFFYSELVFFLKTFFFVYLGLMMQIENSRLMSLGVIISFLLVMVRPIIVAVCKIKASSKDRTFLEIINPKGLAAAVLAQLPVAYHLNHAQDFFTIVITVIFSSIVLTSLLVFITERFEFRGIFGLFNHKKI